MAGPQPAPTGTPDAPAKWRDLSTRVLSAVVLVAVFAIGLWTGGIVWMGLVVAVWVAMLWELAPLCAPGVAGWRRGLVAMTPVLAVVLLWLMTNTPGQMWLLGLPLVVLPTLAGVLLLPAGRAIWLGYSLMMMLGVVFFIIGDEFNPALILALAAIVVISDTLGYFAGRMIGGPKFWPRISPKKTWSGTIAGWLGAALFGAFAVAPMVGPMVETATDGPQPLRFALIAVALAFAGQMGDIAESAIKRRAGVKDASALIPGHGGFLDRLDAMIAAAAAAMVYLALSGPPVLL
ncbi:MAG: phosphatidate cytidylyltransferase [Rhodobacterales bacterium]|nr:MAG: phosphatidate cytidylyltransferase [Rhodobacterales bacterium]